MALETPWIGDITLTAAADLSAYQYHWVKLTTTFTVNVPTAETDSLFGILQNKPVSGGAAQVRVWGVSKLVTDNSVTTAGMKVGTTTTAHGKVKTADRATFGAIALEGSNVAGALVSVLLAPHLTISA